MLFLGRLGQSDGSEAGQVGHQFNIGDAVGVSLAEGEAAVFRPLGTT